MISPEERELVDTTRRLAKLAMGRPWTVARQDGYVVRGTVDDFSLYDGKYKSHPGVCYYIAEGRNGAPASANANYIAYACNAAPTLCDLADRQEAELAAKNARIAELEAELARRSP